MAACSSFVHRCVFRHGLGAPLMLTTYFCRSGSVCYTAPYRMSLAQRLTELDAVTFRSFHKELAQPPRLVGDRLLDKHAT